MDKTSLEIKVRYTIITILCFITIYYGFRNTLTPFDGVVVSIGHIVILFSIVLPSIFKNLENKPFLFVVRLFITFAMLYLIAPKMLYYKNSEHLVVIGILFFIECIQMLKRGKWQYYITLGVAATLILILIPWPLQSKLSRAVDTYVKEAYPEASISYVQQSFPDKDDKSVSVYVVLSQENMSTGEEPLSVWLLYKDGQLTQSPTQ